MASVVVLMVDSPQRTCLQAVLRNRATITFTETESELLQNVATLRPNAVVIELRDGRGRPRVRLIAALRARFATLPVFAYCKLDYADLQALVGAARAGLDAPLLYGLHDEWIVLGALPAATDAERIARQVLRLVDHLVPYPAKPVVRYALTHTEPRARVDEIASALGIHRKTLVERLEHAGLPAPSALISWSRLLCATYVLEESACSVESAAHQSGFHSAAALRRMLKDRAGVRPHELRHRGGFRYLVRRFAAVLQQPACSCPTCAGPIPAPDLAAEGAGHDHDGRSGTNDDWNVA